MKNKIHKEKENSNTGKLNLDRGRKIKIKKLHKNSICIIEKGNKIVLKSNKGKKR